MNEMFEINNIINMKNENDVNASHLKQLIENPIVQQHSFLLNNIKTSILFKTKTYSNSEIIELAELEINNYIENNKQDLFQRLAKLHELPRWISPRNQMSAIFDYDFSKESQVQRAKKLSKKNKVLESDRSLLHLIPEQLSIEALNRSGTAVNNNTYDNILCPGIIVMFLPENKSKISFIKFQLTLHGGNFSPRR